MTCIVKNPNGDVKQCLEIPQWSFFSAAFVYPITSFKSYSGIFVFHFAFATGD